MQETKKDQKENFTVDTLIEDLRQGRTKKYKTTDNPKANGVLLEISYPEKWEEQEGTRPNTLKKFCDKESKVVLVVCVDNLKGFVESDVEKRKPSSTLQEKEGEVIQLCELLKTNEEANAELLKNSLSGLYKSLPKFSKTLKNNIDGNPLFITLVSGVQQHAGNEFATDAIHNVLYINNQYVDLVLSRFYPEANNSEQSLYELHKLNKQILHNCLVLNQYNRTSRNENLLSGTNSTAQQYTTDPQITFRKIFSDKTVQEVYEKAEKGDGNSQYTLGAIYATGEKVPKDDKKAFEWYKKSADQNNPAGQLLVGLHFIGGLGVPRDLNEGLKWIKKSSDQNFPRAQMMLGLAYLDGAGVSKNINKAVYLLQQASDQNDYQAMVKLGLIYYLGELVPQDQNKARDLWRRAAAGGDKEAVKVLEMDKRGR